MTQNLRGRRKNKGIGFLIGFGMRLVRLELS